MTASVSSIVEKFSHLNVLVIGDSILDIYSEGTATRLCPEGPVPVVQITSRRDMPGGAANTAVNLRSMGANVSLVSLTGRDADANCLLSVLDRTAINTQGVSIQPGRTTTAKHRICADGQIVVRADQGDLDPPSDHAERAIIETLLSEGPSADAILVSDYAQGLMTPAVIAALANVEQSRPTLLVVDAKDLRLYQDVHPAAVKPNYQQALSLLGRRAAPSDNRPEIVSHEADELLRLTGSRIAAVTLDSEGALIFERGRQPYRTYAQAAPANRAVGAGDTFVSVLTLALAAGADTPTAAEMASAAAAIVVSKDDTASCSPGELLVQMAGCEKRVRDLTALQIGLEYERGRGRRIVFTNGCFDIVHAGHTAYLNQAKSLGDVLVVGVNSDESVRNLKGHSRPINPLADRVQVLSALSSIDYIVEFDADTPVDIIRAVRPDVFVKGGDYTREMLPEAPVVEEHGGRIEILPYVEDRSTTGIIQRVRERVEGAVGT